MFMLACSAAYRDRPALVKLVASFPGISTFISSSNYDFA